MLEVILWLEEDDRIELVTAFEEFAMPEVTVDFMVVAPVVDGVDACDPEEAVFDVFEESKPDCDEGHGIELLVLRVSNEGDLEAVPDDNKTVEACDDCDVIDLEIENCPEDMLELETTSRGDDVAAEDCAVLEMRIVDERVPEVALEADCDDEWLLVNELAGTVAEVGELEPTTEESCDTGIFEEEMDKKVSEALGVVTTAD